MTLRLPTDNLPNDPPYAIFNQDPRIAMPLMHCRGYRPLNTMELFGLRIAVDTTTTHTRAAKVRERWQEYAYDTSDAVAYHPDGRFKLVLDALPLLRMTPCSALDDGALVLTPATYTALPGKEFRAADRRHFTTQPSEQQALRHEGLRYLLRGQADRIIPATFRIGRRDHYYTEMLRPILSDPPRRGPVMRPWCVGPLDDHSPLYGTTHLERGVRFIGIRHNLPSTPDEP